MRHRVAGRKFGRTTAHKQAMFRNMVTSLILNDRIETTLPKAKELRRWADQMITLAKKNTLSAKRQAMAVLREPKAMQKLFSSLVDRFKDRAGGYTRIMKLGYRHGDNAPMAIIEYLTAEIKKTVSPDKKETKRTDKKAALKTKAGAPKKEKTVKASHPKKKTAAAQKKPSKKEDDK